MEETQALLKEVRSFQTLESQFVHCTSVSHDTYHLCIQSYIFRPLKCILKDKESRELISLLHRRELNVTFYRSYPSSVTYPRDYLTRTSVLSVVRSDKRGFHFTSQSIVISPLNSTTEPYLLYVFIQRYRCRDNFSLLLCIWFSWSIKFFLPYSVLNNFLIWYNIVQIIV